MTENMMIGAPITSIRVLLLSRAVQMRSCAFCLRVGDPACGLCSSLLLAFESVAASEARRNSACNYMYVHATQVEITADLDVVDNLAPKLTC